MKGNDKIIYKFNYITPSIENSTTSMTKSNDIQNNIINHNNKIMNTNDHNSWVKQVTALQIENQVK